MMSNITKEIIIA